ncbi:MAG: glycosyltransferase family 4 protein [Deltaproteobacteria bacterium]|nr:glycosyltransferase family 4 protein [Deltaproteobacteria bacterium]
MKILQVVHYAPFGAAGGCENYSLQLSRELARKHEVAFLYTVPDDHCNGSVRITQQDGFACIVLKKDVCNFDRPFHERSAWVEREFSRALDSFNPDVVHFQHVINLSCTLPSVAKQRGVPTCFTLHDYWLLCPRTILLTPAMEICPGYDPARCLDCLRDRTGYYAAPSTGPAPVRLCKQAAKGAINLYKKSLSYVSLRYWRPRRMAAMLKNIDLFIAPSRFLLEQYAPAFIPEEKIRCCPLGFDTAALHGAPKTESDRVRFAFIGNIQPYKGVHVLIEAFNAIEGPHELKIYGRLDDGARRELARAVSHPRIRFMGMLASQDKQAAFTNMDVLIVPSVWYENYPVVINEAYMTKTPVIASDLGGMAELVEDGKTGLTFRAGDARSLAEKINICIRDPGLLRSFAAHMPPVKDIREHAVELSAIYEHIAGIRT